MRFNHREYKRFSRPILEKGAYFAFLKGDRDGYRGRRCRSFPDHAKVRSQAYFRGYAEGSAARRREENGED